MLIQCPSCGTELKAAGDKPKARCPKCREVFKVAEEDETARKKRAGEERDEHFADEPIARRCFRDVAGDDAPHSRRSRREEGPVPAARQKAFPLPWIVAGIGLAGFVLWVIIAVREPAAQIAVAPVANVQPTAPNVQPAQTQPVAAQPAQIDARGTSWVGQENLPRFGQLVFVLKADYKAIMGDENILKGGSAIKGNWSQVGDRVLIHFQDCVYDGRIAGRALSGQARFTSGNRNGETWDFAVVLQTGTNPAPGPQPPPSPPAQAQPAQPTLPPIRLGIHELRAGDSNDDLELAREKFDAWFKGRVLEVYGQVRRITRHSGGRTTIHIKAPWASGIGPGLTFTVREVDKLQLGQAVLVRSLCQGFRAVPSYRSGYGGAPFVATEAEVVQIPQGAPGNPAAWAALMRLENSMGPNLPVLTGESLDGGVLTVRVRPLAHFAKKIDWPSSPAAQWPASIYAFRFGSDDSKTIVIVDDSTGARVGWYSLRTGPPPATAPVAVGFSDEVRRLEEEVVRLGMARFVAERYALTQALIARTGLSLSQVLGPSAEGSTPGPVTPSPQPPRKGVPTGRAIKE